MINFLVKIFLFKLIVFYFIARNGNVAAKISRERQKIKNLINNARELNQTKTSQLINNEMTEFQRSDKSPISFVPQNEPFSTISGFVINSPVFSPLTEALPPKNTNNETPISAETIPYTEPLTTVEPTTLTQPTSSISNVSIRSDIVEVSEPLDLSSTSRINQTVQSIQSLGEIEPIPSNIPTVIIPLFEQQIANEAIMSETTTTTSSTTDKVKTKSSITISKINVEERPKRPQQERGSLPKKSRKELELGVKFAPRKPAPVCNPTVVRPAHVHVDIAPSTSNATPSQEVEIIDYEYKTYTEGLQKIPGFDEIVTDRFKVLQPEGKDFTRQTNEYLENKRRLHNNRQPSRAAKQKAYEQGYVLDDDWKTQFTIEAFGGVRFVNNKLKSIATQFRRKDGVIQYQWERVENIKTFANRALKEYLTVVNANQEKKLIF